MESVEHVENNEQIKNQSEKSSIANVLKIN